MTKIKQNLPGWDPSMSRHGQFPRRTPRPKPIPNANPDQKTGILWAETITAMWPWRLGEYPGYSACAADALGYAKTTIRRWLSKGARPFPATAADKLVNLLRSKAMEMLRLASEWETYATDARAEAAQRGYKGFRLQKIDEKDGWRSNPRKRVR